MRALPLNLFMTTDAVGGVFTYALDLARALAPMGVRATLAVLGPGLSQDQFAAARAIDGVELRETGQPLDWLTRSPEETTGAAAARRRSGARQPPRSGEPQRPHLRAGRFFGASDLRGPLLRGGLAAGGRGRAA